MLQQMREATAKATDLGAYVASLLDTMEDGRIKLYLTWRLLQLRREQRDLFLYGDYVPLRVTDARTENLVAFARVHSTGTAVVASPRLFVKLGAEQHGALGDAAWLDTVLELPANGPWRNIATGEQVEPTNDKTGHSSMPATAVFANLPWVVLMKT